GFGPLTLDEAAGTLSCQGAMPLALRDELLAERLGPGFSNTIERLFEASHIAPITDVYGYDRGREPPGAYEVRDLMFSSDVLLPDERGQFIVAMTDGNEEFQSVFDLAERKVRLIDSRTGRAMRTAPLADDLPQGPVRVEMSLMDRQVLLAVGGKITFKPWSYAAPGEPASTPRNPVRFGAKRTGVTVQSLKLFPGVYYTRDYGRRTVRWPARLRNNEYFI